MSSAAGVVYDEGLDTEFLGALNGGMRSDAIVIVMITSILRRQSAQLRHLQAVAFAEPGIVRRAWATVARV